jgi:CRISPR/Cas system-associated exonuclease Cas4 (RecB family)
MQLQLEVDVGSDGYKVRHVESSTRRELTSNGRSTDSSVLTKSRYVKGLDNPREMWFEVHGDGAPDVGEQWRLQQGQCVGKVARREFPKGIFVGGTPSEDQLDGSCPLFEATFRAGDLLARTDILRPAGTGSWVLTEVKSSTLKSSKEEAIQDVAFQTYVLERAGLDVERAEILHLNPDYVHPGRGRLLTTTPLGEDREDRIQAVRDKAPELADVLQQPEPPNLWPSRSCNTCDCPETCHDLPEQSLFTLPKVPWQHVDTILGEGKARLDEIEDHDLMKPRHRHHIEAVRAGEPYVDETAIREALTELTFPIHFLDFEAIDYALPRFGGTSPWQKIPFQYSLHILREGGAVEHEEYLHHEDTDPRPPLVENLLDDVESSGSVVVYHDTFERQRLEELQEAFPEREAEIQSLIDRLWDQEEVFKWDFIHPDQKGSTSLKAVLPIFAPELSYDDLDIQHGMAAVVKYAEMLASSDLETREMIYDQLLNYCERDTYAMLRIHNSLAEIADTSS